VIFTPFSNERGAVRAFQITCFVIAVLILSTQGVRHLYVKYFEPTTSALDRFEKKPLTSEIENTTSLDALVLKYEPAKKREDELDAALKKLQREKDEKDRDVFRQEYRNTHKDEYQHAAELRSAIQTWESKAKEIRELHVFWTFGLGMLLLGGLLFSRWPWLGMAFVVPGVAEMIWWTSPSFRMFGSVQEFDRLLNNKIVFTFASLLIVLVAWMLANRLRGKATAT
jgi:hypothetical protein